MDLLTRLYVNIQQYKAKLTILLVFILSLTVICVNIFIYSIVFLILGSTLNLICFSSVKDSSRTRKGCWKTGGRVLEKWRIMWVARWNTDLKLKRKDKYAYSKGKTTQWVGNHFSKFYFASKQMKELTWEGKYATLIRYHITVLFSYKFIIYSD